MQFIVQSRSSGEVYEITLLKGPEKIAFHCSCPAGSVGQHCKHRLALLDGDDQDVLRASHTVAELQAAIAGSEIAAAIDRMIKQEAVVAAEQAKLKAAKKAVARAMLG